MGINPTSDRAMPVGQAGALGERDDRGAETPVRGLAKVVVLGIVLASYGPYLWGSVRTEQALIYGLFIVSLPAWVRMMYIPHWGGRIAASWLVYLLAAVVGVGLPAVNRTAWVEGSMLAGLDNVVLPLAVMSVVWTFVRRSEAQHVLVFATRATALAAAANGLLAVAMTQVDLTQAMRPFVAPESATRIVADLAAQLGRYSGVFGQPAEAGLAYSVAGIAACYGFRNRPYVKYLTLIPIVAGGFVCVSKVFIVGGLLLILWQLWRARRRALGPLVLSATVIAVVAAGTGVVSSWTGLRFFERLFVSSDLDGLVTLYSAGRFGEKSTLESVISGVLDGSPVFGFGLGGLRVAFDNGWVEALVMAGMIGVGAYTLTLVQILLMARAERDRERRSFSTCIAVLAGGASLGIPALTANRAGSVLWMVIAVVALAHQGRHDPPSLVTSEPEPPARPSSTAHRG